MYSSLQVILLLLLTIEHNCLGFYIRNHSENETPPKIVNSINNHHNDEWGVFQNTLGLSQEKVELLKSQKDQQGTKELLNRFIKENPKYLISNAPNHKMKRPRDQYKRLFRTLLNKLKGSNRMLKTSFNFELAERPLKPLKRTRRKIAVKMVSDMSSEHVDHLLKMFYQQNNIHPTDYDNDNDNAEQLNDNSDYGDSDIMPQDNHRDTEMGSDYVYDNLYDDEGDVGLSAKSNKNSEYGSFQDLIMQAKRNQWEDENEETKLHSPDNDHFI